MKEKISTFFKILMQKFEDYYYLMKESVTLSYEFLYIKDININKIANKTDIKDPIHNSSLFIVEYNFIAYIV